MRMSNSKEKRRRVRGEEQDERESVVCMQIAIKKYGNNYNYNYYMM